MRFAFGNRAEGDPNFEAGDEAGKVSGFDRGSSRIIETGFSIDCQSLGF
jgi:hypothetical protein